MRYRGAAIATLIAALALIVVILPYGADAANPNVGYTDAAFGTGPGGAPSGPDATVPSDAKIDATADKPQSKLWYTNDNIWWAVMFHQASGTWHIYRLNWPAQWSDTGVVVDDRSTARADVLWDGTKLYVASLVRYRSTNVGRVYRFSYSATNQTYTLDSGFPAAVMTGNAETMALDKDSTGKLWITYTQNKQVYVNSSTTSDATWGTPFIVPSAQAIGSDDISSLVAYKDKNGPSIGVLWSSHTSTSAASAMNFAYHKDSDAPGSWQPVETIYGGKGTCLADDHINLKSLQADPSGAIFAALKTSVGDSSTCTGGTDLIRLVVRYPDNTWKWARFGGTSDNHTRPIVLLDTTNRQVYMFATAPTSCGVIYYKTSSMDNPSFPAGKGQPFISSSNYTCINNATSTKQTVNASTGLVVLASDESPTNTYRQAYLHNAIALGAPPADTTAPTVNATSPANGATNTSVTASVGATFSEAMNSTTITSANVTLAPSGGAAITATVSYNGATNTVTLVPGAALAAGTSYTARLSTNLKDLAGNNLAAPYIWSFSTAAAPPADTVAPTVTGTTPINAAAGVDASTSISAIFSEAVAGVNANTFTLTGPSGALAASVSYNGTTTTATLVPGAALAPGTTYTANLLTGITDSAGNPLIPVGWSFTTAASPPPSSTRIKDITFENGSLTDPTTGFDSVVNTVSLETGAPLSGADSATVNSSTGYLREDFTGVDELFVSFTIRVNALPSASPRIAQISNSGSTVGELLLTSAGKLRLRNGGTTIGGDSTALIVGQLYRVGLHQKASSSGSAILEAYVTPAGTSFGTPFAASTTQTFAASQATRFNLGATNNTLVSMTVDDIRLDSHMMP